MKLQLVGAIALLGLLAACGARTEVETTAEPAQPAAPEPLPTVEGTVQDALAAMERGDAAHARAVLDWILEREPANPTAQALLAQIETDPRELLGSQNYSYRIRPGDTLSTIARDRLGDASLFFALARYNEIADPRRIVAGQTILIPGTPVAEPSPAPSAPAAPAAPPRPQQAERDPPADPSRARALRAQGLAAMNRGDISRAVTLLSQASRLDPGNGAIRADLARARRVRQALTR